MIALIGLSLIVLAWLVQFIYLDKKKKLSIWFVITYVLGVIFLVYDGFSAGLTNLAVANLVSLIIASAVLIKLKFY